MSDSLFSPELFMWLCLISFALAFLFLFNPALLFEYVDTSRTLSELWGIDRALDLRNFGEDGEVQLVVIIAWVIALPWLIVFKLISLCLWFIGTVPGAVLTVMLEPLWNITVKIG